MEAVIIIGSIISVALVLLLNGFLSSNASNIAQDKGYEKRKWFHMCFWLGPLSYIMIAAMPDLKLRSQQEEISKLLSQQLANASPAGTQAARKESIESILPQL